MVSSRKGCSSIDFNNDYSIYSGLRIINYLKCEKSFYSVDLLWNNIDDINDNRNTYHFLKLITTISVLWKRKLRSVPLLQVT